MTKLEKSNYQFNKSYPKCPNCKKETKFIKYIHSETKITLTCPCCNKIMLYETVEKFNTKEI